MFETDHRRLSKRGRTAIGRPELSRPLKLAISDGIISSTTRILDYGCGRGDDIRRLRTMGYEAIGWDPVHRPRSELNPTSVVNLGYVVNVIEDADERIEALREAWALAQEVLIVSARLTIDARALRATHTFADGCLTALGTFQKFFEQNELRSWIDGALQVKAVPAAPGVFYVFRDEQARSGFIATQHRSHRAKPHLTVSAELFNAHRRLLEPLVQFVMDRGRAPFEDEIATGSEISGVFGSLARAFRAVRISTDDQRWDQIVRERSRDILVYLALSQFDGRTRFGRLPLSLQRDVRAFFGTYKRACSRADALLFSLGKPGALEAACRKSHVGKLTPAALYVHESALSDVSPVLRLYEGCARQFLGRVEGANIIKLHLGEPMVSYLGYPEFERDPHPGLAFAVTVHLQTFRIRTRDYTSSKNRPILHRKELFVAPDHPTYQKFARLTRIEESKGLYEDTRRIGFEYGWNETLARKGLYLRGHRLLVKRGPEPQR